MAGTITPSQICKIIALIKILLRDGGRRICFYTKWFFPSPNSIFSGYSKFSHLPIHKLKVSSYLFLFYYSILCFVINFFFLFFYRFAKLIAKDILWKQFYTPPIPTYHSPSSSSFIYDTSLKNRCIRKEGLERNWSNGKYKKWTMQGDCCVCFSGDNIITGSSMYLYIILFFYFFY